MKHITTDELKRVATEGLVLQGCGGNPQEWLDGINDMFTEANILLDGDTFKNISVFEHDGHTNILFDMEDVKLNAGKLAIWRLQTHDTFGGTWLSDYLPNRFGVKLGELAPEPAPMPPSTDKRLTVSTSEPVMHVLSACFEHPEEEHSGWWLGFPTNTESVQTVLKELGIYDGDIIANRYSSAVKHLEDCLGAVMQTDNIDELNYLAAILQNLSVYEMETFEAVLQARRHTDSVKDIINIAKNLDRFELQPAYGPEMYGSALLEMEKDDTSAVFQRLEKSEDPDERAFAQYILKLEAHVDEEGYGRAAAEAERGSFTDHGYLTESEGFKEIYRGPEDIPAEYRVFAYPEPERFFKTEPADLAAFLYKLHALAGDYMSDAHYNISALLDGSEHYLLLANGKSIYLCEMESAYHRDATANDIWTGQAVTPDTKAFLLHVTGRNGDRISGSITELDHEAVRRDILAHSIGCVFIGAKLKNGTEQSYTREEWAALTPVDLDRVESWGRRYDMRDTSGLSSHVDQLCERLEASAQQTHPEAILEKLNRGFTEQVTGHSELFRIAHAAAKEITARGDAPVYRILPDKEELLTTLDAVRGGAIFSDRNAFAVKMSDIDSFLKWAERGAGDIVRAASRGERDKTKSQGQEH